MKFKTEISKITDEGMIIRGKQLSDLIKGANFSDAVFLILRGKIPSSQESKIFGAILTSVIDHGMGTTSSLTTRFVTSGGNTLNASVAGGVLALGDFHGGAIENAMKQFAAIEDVDTFVSDHLEAKKVIFGFGHKVYKEKDPRVTEILNVCTSCGFSSQFIEQAKQVEAVIQAKKGRKIPLNVDGIIAAILLEMGFDYSVGKGIFVIGRTPGLVAQSLEEKHNEKPVRRVDEADIEYHGN